MTLCSDKNEGGACRKNTQKKGKSEREREKRRHSWEVQTTQRCEFDLICEAFLSGNSISCVVVSASAAGWNPCARLQRDSQGHIHIFFLQDLDKERKT